MLSHTTGGRWLLLTVGRSEQVARPEQSPVDPWEAGGPVPLGSGFGHVRVMVGGAAEDANTSARAAVSVHVRQSATEEIRPLLPYSIP
ncbi:hypothetical protein AQJ11_32780 [Streptomyces corchorusii]|uniref:Uncharacterized protein n=1 Tax=Streptomyces corchorusii TaxID=1903 RepID=A0A101PWA3_STRCK|nr:hypothetical protein AQJ11_32780 [Streptomyces corchorusii]